MASRCPAREVAGRKSAADMSSPRSSESGPDEDDPKRQEVMPGLDAILRDAYLTLVEDALLGQFAPAGDYLVPISPASRKNKLLARLLATRGVTMGEWRRESRDDLEHGNVCPLHALTMIGRARLRNIRFCIESALNNNVAGDVIETGVWRGGASIYARAVLRAWDVVTGASGSRFLPGIAAAKPHRLPG